MIGLYLLITRQLAKDHTIKFGMSMRLEYRWIDYLAIFSDSEYVYYYEFIDDLTREEILNIESNIIQLHHTERNEYYQTEYFYSIDHDEFHLTIINELDKYKINYRIHNKHDFERKYYDNKPESFEPNIKLQSLTQTQSLIQTQTQTINEFKPYDYQLEIIDQIENFYLKYDIGNIIWCCGLGKALIGVLIVNRLRFKSVIIGVPSIYLQKQMKNEIMKIFNNDNDNDILYVGGNPELNIEYTTNDLLIEKFISKESSNCKFIISTYDSCHKLVNYKFDFKIGDEAHHLVGSDLDITKRSFHSIRSSKTLFMTATEKIINTNQPDRLIYSMDDKNIFGNLIDSKSIQWAITNNKITDYKILIVKNTESEINNIINNLGLDPLIINRELFLSAYMALKSIEKYNDLTHILIYTNKTTNAELVNQYINLILDLNIINISKLDYYLMALHSNSKEKLDDEINKFKKASWGIISSVYIFGEGFDCVQLNGVVFGESMESEIRIVQSVLRPNRLNKANPDKIAYVIIPYIDTEDFLTDSESFDKCRKIIYKIRNIDNTIEQKINVISIKSKSKSESEEIDSSDESTESTESKNNKIYNIIIENGDELEKIILRLRYSKSLDSINTEEQDEFNYVRSINTDLFIQSKESYSNQQIITRHKNYIPNPEEYFRLKGVWTNWYDFIGVDTGRFIQCKIKWINFCKENNIKSLNDYNRLCKFNDILPINPADFYKDFKTIPIELELYTKRRK